VADKTTVEQVDITIASWRQSVRMLVSFLHFSPSWYIPMSFQ